MPVLMKNIIVVVASCLICLQTLAGPNQGPLIVLGSFSSPLNAEQMLQSMRPHTNAKLQIASVRLGGPLYRVAAGPFGSLAEAQRQLSMFRQQIPDAWLDFSQVPVSETASELTPDPHNKAQDKETPRVVDAPTKNQRKQVIRISRFSDYDSALEAAEQLSRQFAMPLLVTPLMSDNAASRASGPEGQGFQLETLGMDQTIAPLVLTLIRKRFPLAVLEPSAL